MFRWEIEAAATSGVDDLIFGVAEGWGRVLLGAGGWRSQYARPLAIYLPGTDDRSKERARGLVRGYGLAVYRDLESMTTEWGPGDDTFGLEPRAA